MNNDWIEEFKEALMQQISDSNLSNAGLAEQFSISERKLYRKVKELTGQTPNHYIRDLKLQKAHELLESGNYLTVKEVVPLVGFVKVKYFYKIFKEKYGFPPGQILREKGLKN